MPIDRPWLLFSEIAINLEQDESGVYELGNRTGSVIYLGSSSRVRQRLKEHLNAWSTTCLKKHTAKYRVEYTSKFKAREWELYDQHVRSHSKPPRCNAAREFPSSRLSEAEIKSGH
jgi:predicted GIY-YIG superfamily endonuclease